MADAPTGKIANLLTAIAGLVVAVVDLLPAEWANWVHGSRKFVVTGVGGAVSLLAALHELPLPPNVAGPVAAGLMAFTALATWLTPNRSS
jgi:hypothetical protein